MKEYFFEIGKKYRVYHGGTPTEQYLKCDEIHESVVWFYDSSGNLISKYNKRRIMDKNGNLAYIAGNIFQVISNDYK